MFKMMGLLRRWRKARRSQASAEDSSQGSTDAVTNDSQYHHEALLDEEKFFRLLELLPGREDDAIHCRLRTYSINSHPIYDAVSYVWGHEEDKTHVFCNRKSLLIPWNLYDVLKRLRCQETSRILWADSICIDQSNDDERGHQVQLMRAIFKQAENVHAWLGRGDTFDSVTAFQLIDHLYDLWNSDGLTDKSIQQISGYQWTQLRTLFHSPWFERVWVLQEVGLASNAFLLCGLAKTHWKNLICPSRDLNNLFRLKMEAHDINLTKVYRMDLDFVHGKKQDVRTVLAAVEARHCSDPRDRIYAVLGHVAFERLGKEGGGTPFIITDYSTPVSNLYLDTAKKLLGLPNPLYILSMIKHTNLTINDSHQVSWVPQWRNYFEWTPGKLGDIDDSLACYRACGSTKPLVQVDNKTLVVDGFCLDSVKWQSASFGPVHRSQELDATFKICFFFGAQVSFILRPLQNSGEYRLCGECYVDGMMYGDVLEILEDGELEQETFRIV